MKVVVTGAAGQIAYSLIPRLVDGRTFGDKKVDLALVEIPQVVSKLEGLVMELEDSYFPNMGEVTFTDNFEEASKDGDWFLLVGSIPRGIVYNGKKIEERLNPKYEGRFKIMLVPNVTNICYGRGVGYKIEEIVLSEEIQKISATKIRAKMREEGKLK